METFKQSPLLQAAASNSIRWDFLIIINHKWRNDKDRKYRRDTAVLPSSRVKEGDWQTPMGRFKMMDTSEINKQQWRQVDDRWFPTVQQLDYHTVTRQLFGKKTTHASQSLQSNWILKIHVAGSLFPWLHPYKGMCCRYDTNRDSKYKVNNRL